MTSEFTLAHVNETIATAAIKSGRSPEAICLVGVTKSMDSETIKRLVATGVSNLGENRVQDFLPKHEALGGANSLTWHFIGHLQRNKVKFIIDKVDMIHSLDSLNLAIEVERRAKQANKIMDVLIEVNIASEESKQGVTPLEAVILAEELTQFSNICVKGLMCVAPFVKNPEENRKHFYNMRKLLIDINCRYPHNLGELSMGMSGDYAVAIEEGATMVRIGTALVNRSL